MKRIISVLVTMMLLLTMVACGTTQNTTSGESTTQEVTTTAGSTAEELISFPLKNEITLNVFTGIPSTGWAYDYNTLADSAVFQKIKELTNIKFKFENVEPEAWSLALETKMATGDLPDLVGLGGVTPSQYTKIVKSGKILKLNDYYQKYAKESWENITGKPEYKAKVMAVDGNIYHAMNVSTFWDSFYCNLVWNVDAVKAAGFDPNALVTTDSFYEILKAMKNNGITAPYIPGITQDANIYGLDFSVYGFYADNGVVKNNYANPRFKEWLTWLNKLYNEGLIPKDFDAIKKSTDGVSTLISKDKLGVMSSDLGSGFGYNPIAEKAGLIAADGDARWLGMDPIQGPYGDRFEWTVPNVQPQGWSISSASKYPAEAFLWLVTRGNDESMKEVSYWGVEGKSYKIGANGEKEWLTPAEYFKAGAQYPWSDFYKVESWAKGLPRSPKYQEQYTKRAEEMWKPEFYKLGFPNITLTDDETNERDKYLTDFNTFVEEQTIKFVKGIIPLDKFDDYVKSLDTAGLDKLTKVYQSMYDRYLELVK